MGGVSVHNESSDKDRWGRILLSRLAEGGDARVGQRIRDVGGEQAACEILTGCSPLAHAATLSARLPSAPPHAAWSLEDAVGEDLKTADRLGGRYLIPGDSEWPTQVDDLGSRAPWGLWVVGAGHLRLLALRSVSVVGARAATAYGESIARSLAAELASRRWLVVSGGAFGIDAAAHRGALAVDGATACILAGGVDVPYPRSHSSLLACVRDSGLLVSESALGAAPMRQRFLQRNRLIAALTRGTVVVEAAVRSGSLTTARQARDLRRVVMAFPGPITSPMSAGTHALIRDGDALLVGDVREVMSLLGDGDFAADGGASADAEASESASGGRTPSDLGVREARVLDAVPLRSPAPMERLARTCGLSPTDVLIAVGILEARGLVSRVDRGWVRAAAVRAS